MKRATAVLSAVILGACAMSTPASEVEITEIVRGHHSPQTEALFEYVTTPERLNALWRLARTSERPAVDFSQQAVIAAFMGERMTGGHAIEVARATRVGDVLEVELVLSSPGPGCMTTQALTQPFVFAAVPAGATEARFTTRNETVSCE